MRRTLKDIQFKDLTDALKVFTYKKWFHGVLELHLIDVREGLKILEKQKAKIQSFLPGETNPIFAFLESFRKSAEFFSQNLLIAGSFTPQGINGKKIIIQLFSENSLLFEMHKIIEKDLNVFKICEFYLYRLLNNFEDFQQTNELKKIVDDLYKSFCNNEISEAFIKIPISQEFKKKIKCFASISMQGIYKELIEEAQKKNIQVSSLWDSWQKALTELQKQIDLIENKIYCARDITSFNAETLDQEMILVSGELLQIWDRQKGDTLIPEIEGTLIILISHEIVHFLQGKILKTYETPEKFKLSKEYSEELGYKTEVIEIGFYWEENYLYKEIFLIQVFQLGPHVINFFQGPKSSWTLDLLRRAFINDS